MHHIPVSSHVDLESLSFSERLCILVILRGFVFEHGTEWEDLLIPLIWYTLGR